MNHGRLRRVFIVFAVAVMSSFALLHAGETDQRPNIIWIISEDMGPDLGCWGVSVHTPNIDRLVKVLAERKELSPLHRKLLFDPLPEEELYDLSADPHELKNLAADPAHTELKDRLRSRVENWIKESGDRGFEKLDPKHVAFFDRYRENNHKRLKAKREALRKQVEAVVDKKTKQP